MAGKKRKARSTSRRSAASREAQSGTVAKIPKKNAKRARAHAGRKDAAARRARSRSLSGRRGRGTSTTATAGRNHARSRSGSRAGKSRAPDDKGWVRRKNRKAGARGRSGSRYRSKRPKKTTGNSKQSSEIGAGASRPRPSGKRSGRAAPPPSTESTGSRIHACCGQRSK